MKFASLQPLLAVIVGDGIACPSAMPFIDSKNGIPSLAPLFQEVTPAVVNISVQARFAIEDNPLFRDPFFRRFFESLIRLSVRSIAPDRA